MRRALAPVLWSAATAAAVPPERASASSCANLTGIWCCSPTQVVQTGNKLATAASYGTGEGDVDGDRVSVRFSTSGGPLPLTGVVYDSCGCISWANSKVWNRQGVQCGRPPSPFTPPPPWADSLSIYEVNPRGFSSPGGAGDGSGSGTWAGLTQRLAHLRDTGVTGMWLAGWSLAQARALIRTLVPAHFYGIWSVYGTVRPDLLDPSLGTAQEFQAMIDTAHSYGIKVLCGALPGPHHQHYRLLGALPPLSFFGRFVFPSGLSPSVKAFECLQLLFYD
eukprot:gene4918-5059_t